MKTSFGSRSKFRRTSSPWFFAGAVFALIFALESAPFAYGRQQAQPKVNADAPIPAVEFARMVQEFSEPGGYFHSDNFTSNETSYLHIVSRMKELGVTGGAYIGVGPEQNFTYIAKVRPRIAFIVDIRRQAIIQHLLYKAIFHVAENRTQFLAWLFSKPIPPPGSRANESLEALLDYIREFPAPAELFAANLETIRKTIEENFHFPLDETDSKSLKYVYDSFRQGNLLIGFRFGTGGYASRSYGFPTLEDLILATDLGRERGNFLAVNEDYAFVRNLQEQNRVIPVVGDFAGKKAFTTVGNYLRQNGYTVSAFYTSNVEQFLFENELFSTYAENIRKLPISDRSVFIRAARLDSNSHSAWRPGDRMTPLLEKISVFLDDFKQGLYPDYWSLVSTHYIAALEPWKLQEKHPEEPPERLEVQPELHNQLASPVAH